MKTNEESVTRLTWCPPVGDGFIVSPSLADLEAAMLHRGAEFWGAGCCDGGLYFDSDSRAVSELYLAFSEGAGFLVRHTDCVTHEERALASSAPPTETVVIHPGSNAWRLPRSFFVDRATAWDAVQQFRTDGSRAPNLPWAPFDFPELEP